jgi:predicted RNA-binding Zn-ribbon protein involved in translation (DUF1610 family)
MRWLNVALVLGVILLVVCFSLSYHRHYKTVGLDDTPSLHLINGCIEYSCGRGDPDCEWRASLWWGVIALYVLLFVCNTQRNARITRSERLKNRQCLGCGYSLTGNVSGNCPECGRIARVIPLVRKASMKQAKTDRKSVLSG